MPRLIFRNGPYPGMSIELRKGLNKIGRNVKNDFQILEPSISGFHCELQVSDLGVAFRDVGSTNGSFVNGKRVGKELLVPGQILKLGDVEFDFEIPGSPVVAIPDRPKVEEQHANFLEDGTAACQNHATVTATRKCVRCEKTWCEQCVRKTGLAGRAPVITCMECGGACAPIVYNAPKKKGFFGLIDQTMRMLRKK